MTLLLDRAAHHEAGHLVAYVHFRYPIRAATLALDGTGETRGLIPAGRRHYLNRAIISLAGLAAEAHLTGGDSDVLDGASVDLEHARRLLSRTSDETVGNALDAACCIIAGRWGLVRRLADALIERGTLDGNDLASIVNRERPR